MRGNSASRVTVREFVAGVYNRLDYPAGIIELLRALRELLLLPRCELCPVDFIYLEAKQIYLPCPLLLI